MGKRLTLVQIKELRSICIDSGAIVYGSQLLNDYLAEATKLIEKLVVKNIAYKKYLLSVVELLKKLYLASDLYFTRLQVFRFCSRHAFYKKTPPQDFMRSSQGNTSLWI
jgi:hypothetical protein